MACLSVSECRESSYRVLQRLCPGGGGGGVSVGLGCGEAAAGDQSQASTRPTLLFREGGCRAGKLIKPLLYSRTHNGNEIGESEKSLRGLRFKLVPQNLNLENMVT